MVGSLGVFELVFVALVYGVFIYGLFRICKQAGYPGSSLLLLMIPFVNMIVLMVFAFARWPVTGELERLKRFEASCTCQPEKKSAFPYPGGL